jgi:hypothetical protein
MNLEREGGVFMRVFGVLLVMMGLWGSGYAASTMNSSANFIDYRIRNNQYAVVYVDSSSKASESTMRKKAMQRAAEITKDHGYRYFSVEDEQSVYVGRSYSPEQGPPTNLYQELIVERGFSRDRYNSDMSSYRRSGIFPAYKMTIRMYEDKPARNAEDVCKYTKCR